MKNFVFILISFMCCQWAEAQSRRRKNDNQNTADANKNTEEIAILGIKSKFLSKDSTSATIFMRVELSKAGNLPIRWREFSEKFTLNYVLYPDFASRERLAYGNVPINEQNVVQLSSTKYMVRFELKKPSNHDQAVLLSEISEIGTTKKVLNDLAVRFKETKLSDRFALFEKTGQVPMLQNYVNINDTILIKDINKTVKPLYVMRYKHDFEAASSPMNTTPRSTSYLERG
ncbi:MAG: hypothetical protein R2822_12850 [Spirosomataceae bacterium]